MRLTTEFWRAQYNGNFAMLSRPDLLSDERSAKDILISILDEQAKDDTRAEPSSLALYPSPWIVPQGRPRNAGNKKDKKENRRVPSAMESKSKKNKKQKVTEGEEE